MIGGLAPTPMFSANADGAETEHHVAAGSRTAKTHHGAEAREKQNLVKLAAKFHARRPGENLVIRHLAVRVDGDINQQAVRQRKLTVLLLRRPGFRVVRRSEERR